jgi:predicted nucleotidyltransferase
MSYHENIVRLKSVANALGALKDKVVFVGGATVSLYASRPLAVSVRPTDDVDVAIELISLNEFYTLQDNLLKLGFKHDVSSPIISRFLLDGLKVDFMPTDSSILGFSNQWYPEGLRTSIIYNLDEEILISIFSSPYFIASKMEAFKTRGKSDLYWSHDLEDIIFVLDNRDSIDEELLNADANVKKYLQQEFTVLLNNASFEEALIAHVEQSDQTQRKNRIMTMLKTFVMIL